MRGYQFKVSIIGIPKLYRVIEASENCTFNDLHEAIFQAFDRYDEHLYSFFITGENTKNMRRIMDSPEITHPQNMKDFSDFGKPAKSAAKTKIKDAGLNEKDIFHYWFDFGDDWWHRIRVEKISEAQAGKKYINIVKSVGESPPQYPDYDDDYDDDEDDYDEEYE